MKAILQSSLELNEITDFENSDFYKNNFLKSYHYSKTSIDYYSEYFGMDYTNKSIIVYDDNNPILMLVAYSNAMKLTHFNGAISVIESDFKSLSQKNEAYRLLVQKLNELIKQESFEQIYFYSNDYLNAEYYSKINESQVEFSSIIELDMPTEMIQMNIRKSYKSLVNWGKKNLQLHVMKRDNASYERFLTFRDFHIQVAGKKTRSDETWQKQYNAILKNEAFLVMAYYNDELVSSSFIMLGKEIAYYGVGVYNRDLMAQNLPIAHFNILTSINIAKEYSCKLFDLGFINLDNSIDKEINIFKFKSGFSNQLNSKNKFVAKFNIA